MKTRLTVLGLFALGLAPMLPASAQNPTTYDPIMEKRVDLRLKWLHVIREAANAMSEREGRPLVQRDAQDRIVIPAQGSSYLLDFQVASSKRGDLRLAWIHDGVDVAYTNWLRRERPYAYQQYVHDASAKAGGRAAREIAVKAAK